MISPLPRALYRKLFRIFILRRKGSKPVAKPRQRKSKARTATGLRHGKTVDVYIGKRWVAGWFVIDVTGNTVGVQTRGGDTSRVRQKRVRPSRA
jgi:hypothetical protein